MTLPDTSILTSLVERVFRIEDVTSGDPQKGVIARYRGRLLSRDTEAEYDRLADSLKQYGILPLFRSEPNGRHVILLTPRLPNPRPVRVSTNIVLFILTVFSVMIAGIPREIMLTMPPDFFGQIFFYITNILTGWPFAVSLLSILLAHEFGHYLMSRYHKTAATLPYFIPLPFVSPLGTMGAAILMQATPKNKRILFDIGVAGPLAGTIIAIPVLLFGLSVSRIDVIKNTVWPPVPEERAAFCPDPSFFQDGSYVCRQDDGLEGNSLLYLAAKYVIFGRLLPIPSDYESLNPLLYWARYFFTGQPMPLGGLDVIIDPIAFAGWAGLLVTALNLLPAGTLDGGHLVYALFGEKASKAFPVLLVIMGVLGLFWSGWWLWAVLLLWLGRVHAQPLDQITPLNPARRVVAILTLGLFLLVFSPVPFVVF